MVIRKNVGPIMKSPGHSIIGFSVDTVTIKDPIEAFIFGRMGLIANATIEGAKFTKLVR